MNRNRKEPRFIIVLSNWIVTAICGLYGLVYGLIFLASIYGTVIFHLGLSTQYIPLWLIFVSLALAILYLASASEIYRWTRTGGIFGLIANALSLSMLLSQFASVAIPFENIDLQYTGIVPSIAIILILLCWDYLDSETYTSKR